MSEYNIRPATPEDTDTLVKIADFFDVAIEDLLKER